MNTLEEMLGFLVAALREPLSRKESVAAFLRCFFKTQLDVERSIGRNATDILDELAYDLNFFVADPNVRAESPSYYGDERLVSEISGAVRRLSEVGVAVPDL